MLPPTVMFSAARTPLFRGDDAAKKSEQPASQAEAPAAAEGASEGSRKPASAADPRAGERNELVDELAGLTEAGLDD